MDDLESKPLGTAYNELFHVMQEHNELLNCLIDQKQNADVQSPTGEIKFKSGVRKPKDDKEVIEELKTVNDKLRHLVEKAQQEIRHLKDENAHLRKELNTLKNAPSSSNKSIPELPPLEPPKLLY